MPIMELWGVAHTSHTSFGIARLPNELLAYIFLHLVRRTYAEWADPLDDDPDLCRRNRSVELKNRWASRSKWTPISLVCAHWRNVVLDSAILWSYIITHSPHWIDVCLARSRQAPLRICMCQWRLPKCNFQLDLTLAEKFIPHAKRIEEFFLMTTWDIRKYYVLPRVLSNASALRKLRIYHPWVTSSWGIANPTSLLSSESKLDNMIDLRLHLDVNFPGFFFAPNMTEILAVLGRMKNLAHLTLVYATGIEDFPWMNNDPFEKIDLAQLSYMKIAAPLPAIVALMAGIRFPSNAKVRLQNNCGDTEEGPIDEIAQCCSVLAQHYSDNWMQSATRQMIRSVGISLRRQGLLRLTFNTVSKCICCDLPWDDQTLMLEIHFPAMVDTGELIQHHVKARDLILVHHICAAMPLSQATHLYVNKPPICSDFWHTFLGYVPAVRDVHLAVRNKTCGNILRDMARQWGEHYRVVIKGKNQKLCMALTQSPHWKSLRGYII